MEKSYYHVGAQVIAQETPGINSELFYYIHDRLGSVRAVIDTDMQTVNEYSYDSFGKMFTEECYEATDSGTGELLVDNPFKYTGQYYDAEIDQYYVRARQYDPAMRRFTGRDPQQGSFEQTMTLHRYLYCWNNPTNLMDLNGRNPMLIGAGYGAVLAFTTEIFRQGFEGKGLDWTEIMVQTLNGALWGAIAGIADIPGVPVDKLAGDFFKFLSELAGVLTNLLINQAFAASGGDQVAMITSANGVYLLGNVTREQADVIGRAWCDAAMA